MEWIKIAIQVIVAASIFNVWILRFRKPTSWRGGAAKSMQEEFEVYGLSHWFLNLVGIIKLTLASLLILGLFLPALIQPAALGMVILMLGAIAMHLKVKDSLLKSLPAFSLLVLSLILAFL